MLKSQVKTGTNKCQLGLNKVTGLWQSRLSLSGAGFGFVGLGSNAGMEMDTMKWGQLFQEASPGGWMK